MAEHFVIMSCTDKSEGLIVAGGMQNFISQVVDEEVRIVFIDPNDTPLSEMTVVMRDKAEGNHFWLTMHTFCFAPLLSSGAQVVLFAAKIVHPKIIGGETNLSVMVHFQFETRYMTDLSYSEQPQLAIVHKEKRLELDRI